PEVILHKEGVKQRLVGPGGIAVDQPAGGLSQQKRSVILADRSRGGIVQWPACVGSAEIITAARMTPTIIVLPVCPEIVTHSKLVAAAAGDFGQRWLQRVDVVRQAASNRISEHGELPDFEARHIALGSEERGCLRRKSERLGIEIALVRADVRFAETRESGPPVEHGRGRERVDVIEGAGRIDAEQVISGGPYVAGDT